MAGFFDDVGSWWNNMTGATQQGTGNRQQEAAAGTLGQAAGNAANIAGTTGAQSAARSIETGRGLGEEMGREAATAGAQHAAAAARASGLNKGQAALVGGQQAGGQYTQGMQAGRGMGMQAYEQGANRQLGGAQTQAAVGGQQGALGGQQYEQGRQQGQDFWSGVSKLAGGVGSLLQSSVESKEDVAPAAPMVDALPKPGAGSPTKIEVSTESDNGWKDLAKGIADPGGGAALGKDLLSNVGKGGGGGGGGMLAGLANIAGLFSDEKAKGDVKASSGMLDKVSEEVEPVTFRYKDGMGEGKGKQVGVIAQDLEKTPLASVVENTPRGKMIDTRKLSTANLDLIIELASRVRELERAAGK